MNKKMSEIDFIKNLDVIYGLSNIKCAINCRHNVDFFNNSFSIHFGNLWISSYLTSSSFDHNMKRHHFKYKS